MSFPIAAFERLKLDDLDIIDAEMGLGNFCEVSKAIIRKSEIPVALKKISKSVVERLNKEMDVIMERHALQR
jgi:hypothetical protein